MSNSSLPYSRGLADLQADSDRPVEQGSVAGPLGYVGQYMIQVIKKMQKEHIKRLVPRQDMTDRFNEHAQEWIKHTVWKDNCRSWYKDNKTGRVNAVWPGSSLHYSKPCSRCYQLHPLHLSAEKSSRGLTLLPPVEALQSPRWEDFEYAYLNKNPFAYMGMGRTMEDITENADFSPYLNSDAMDPRWLKAVGSPNGERKRKAC